MLKKYYSLTKPGIIYGNLLTAAGGFLLSTEHSFDIGLFVATMLGTSLIIGSACAFNNYMDRDIDKLMTRTKKRVLVENSLPVLNALIFASVIGLAGFLIIGLFVNNLTLVIGIIAFIVYVTVYDLSKRKSVHGTLVGSIAGSAPIVAGYCAVTGRFNFEALLLFLILTVWQMPHFYSIALYRFDDYKEAKVPVLPVKKGKGLTKSYIQVYIGAFTVLNILMYLFDYVHVTYLVIMGILSLIWLIKSWNLPNMDITKWAKKMFLFSLIIILALSVMLAVGHRLP